MSRPIAVLRPEPGNAATAARIEAAGGVALRLPMFEVRPLGWAPPDPNDHDAVILTSANAVRHAGPQLAAIAMLPVYAVGRATADAARVAGLNVVAIGSGDALQLAHEARRLGIARAVHLAGRDRVLPSLPGVSRTIVVYASNPVEVDPSRVAQLRGAVALVHSPRGGFRLAELAQDRTTIAVIAISAVAAEAVGPGWQQVVIATSTDDAAMVAAGLALTV